MARTDNLNNFLTDVATAIRTKSGTSGTIQASAFDTAISNIPSGGGDDWSDIGYSSTPQAIDDIHDYSKDIYDNWDADNPYKFQNDTNLVILPEIDTSKMSDMSVMFSGCNNLREIKSIVMPTTNTNNNSMFYNCINIKVLDLNYFNTSNVTNMFAMFSGCNNLETITFGNNFVLTSVSGTGLNSMFYNCKKLDNDTLNQILHICTTTTSVYGGDKTLLRLGINSSFVNYNNISNLSNYQDFLNAGWTIS